MREYEAKIDMVAIGKLKPSKDNARRHSKEQINFLCELIKSFGFDQPIVTDAKFTIIKGHGRLMAAKQLKMKQVPVLVRTDMKKAYADLSRMVDNDTVEQNWDEDTLTLEAATLDKMETDFGMEVDSRIENLLDKGEAEPVLNNSEAIPFELKFKHTCPHCEYRWG